jgi:hypothetical protein
MELRHQGSNSVAYQGAGTIRQGQDRAIEFVLFDVTTRQPNELLGGGDHPSGRWIRAEDLHSLTATGLNGAEWTSRNVHLSPSSSYDYPGAIVRGKLAELTSTRERRAEGTAFWAFFPADVDIPTNAGTTVEHSTAGRKRRRGFKRNAWKASTSIGDLLLTKNALGIELTLTSASPLPPDLELRLEELLTFTLGIRVQWAMYATSAYEQERQVLLPFSAGASRSRRRPPLEWSKFEALDDLCELQGRYLDFLLRTSPRRGRYHPLSVRVARVLTAAAQDVENEALALGVQIEGLVRDYFAVYGTPPATDLEAIEDLLNHLESCSGNSLLPRVRNMVEQMKGSNPRRAMQRLVQEGVLEERHRKAWDARNVSAHGLTSSDPVPVIADRSTVAHQAMLLLIFHLIGYTKRFTDYTTLDWPLRPASKPTETPLLGT